MAHIPQIPRIKTICSIILVEQSNRDCGKKDLISYFQLSEKMGAVVGYQSSDFEKKDLMAVM